MFMNLRLWLVRQLLGKDWINYWYCAQGNAQEQLDKLCVPPDREPGAALSDIEKYSATQGYVHGTLDACDVFFKMIGEKP